MVKNVAIFSRLLPMIGFSEKIGEEHSVLEFAADSTNCPLLKVEFQVLRVLNFGAKVFR